MHVCMSTVHKAARSVSVLWCVRKCWFETAFTKLDVEDIKEKGTLLAHFLQSWHLQDHLRMECSCPALSTMVKTVFSGCLFLQQFEYPKGLVVSSGCWVHLWVWAGRSKARKRLLSCLRTAFLLKEL